MTIFTIVAFFIFVVITIMSALITVVIVIIIFIALFLTLFAGIVLFVIGFAVIMWYHLFIVIALIILIKKALRYLQLIMDTTQ